MSQELIKTLRWLSDYDNNNFIFCANTCMQAADTIQSLLDGADEVNQALREQIAENERLRNSGLLFCEDCVHCGEIMPDCTCECKISDRDIWAECSPCEKWEGKLRLENDRLKKELEWKDKVIELAQRKGGEHDGY